MKILEIFEHNTPTLDNNDYSILFNTCVSFKDLDEETDEVHSLLKLYNKFYDNVIKKECSDFLQKSHDYSLYRGMTPTLPCAVKGKTINILQKNNTFNKRKPADTAVNISKMIDDLYELKTGIRYRTQNVVFCTPEINQANQYGYPYVIFPVGKIKYAFMPEIVDFSLWFYENELPNIVKRLNNPLLNQLFDPILTDYKSANFSKVTTALQNIKQNIPTNITKLFFDEIQKSLNKLDIVHNGDMMDAIKSNDKHGVEIMIQCESYYTVNALFLKLLKGNGPNKSKPAKYKVNYEHSFKIG